MSINLITGEVESGGSEVKDSLDYAASLRTACIARNPVSMTTNTKHKVQQKIQLSLTGCKAFRLELISGLLLMSRRKDYYKGIVTALEQSVHLAVLPWESWASIESTISSGYIDR